MSVINYSLRFSIASLNLVENLILLATCNFYLYQQIEFLQCKIAFSFSCMVLSISLKAVLLIILTEGSTPRGHWLFQNPYMKCSLVSLCQKSHRDLPKANKYPLTNFSKHVGRSIKAPFQRLISSIFQRSDAGCIPAGASHIRPWENGL